MSTGASSKHTLASEVNNSASPFLSAPNLTSEVRTPPEHRRELNLSTTQILALSAQDISASLAMIQRENAESAAADTSKKSAEDKKAAKSFKWRLVYDPRCLAIGFAMLTYEAAFGVVMSCIPPLGKQLGML